MFEEINLALVIVGLALAFILAIYAVARRYKKVGPNQVMIISGRKYRIKTPDGRAEEVGFRIRRGGGAFILPLVEKVDLLGDDQIRKDEARDATWQPVQCHLFALQVLLRPW